MDPKKIAVVVGSCRKDSINKQLAQALAKLAPPELKCEFPRIDDLPLFSQDLEQPPPASVVRLRSEIAAAKGLLFVTPEHNRSIPSALKNALDWGSRPYGQNCWAGKPAALCGASPGAIGTAMVQAHLRSVLGYLDVPLLGQPEVYLQMAPGLIDANGDVTNEKTKQFLQSFVARFAAWVGKVAG